VFPTDRPRPAAEGVICLVDVGRLYSLKPVLHFPYMNAMRQPHIFSLDYEHSLRAAFLREVFENLARAYLVPEVGVFTTFKIPVLHIVKTPDRGLSAETRAASVKCGRRCRGNIAATSTTSVCSRG